MLFTGGDDGGDDAGDDGKPKRFSCFACTVQSVPCLSCSLMMPADSMLVAAAVAFRYTSPNVPDRSIRISPVEPSLLHLCCGCGVLCFSQPEMMAKATTAEMTVCLNVSVALLLLSHVFLGF